eukprot:scaffold27600_cov124-Isochrysis_galbana.AAC.6
MSRSSPLGLVADGSGRTPTVGVPRVLYVVCACVRACLGRVAEWRQSRTLRTPERGWPQKKVVDYPRVLEDEERERKLALACKLRCDHLSVAEYKYNVVYIALDLLTLTSGPEPRHLSTE